MHNHNMHSSVYKNLLFVCTYMYAYVYATYTYITYMHIYTHIYNYVQLYIHIFKLYTLFSTNFSRARVYIWVG